MPTFVSKKEFAEYIGTSQAYVSKLVKKGKLIISKDGKKVELKQSLENIKRTADPSNDSATTMKRSDGRDRMSVGMKLKNGLLKEQENDSEEVKTKPTIIAGVENQYQGSRAVKESYIARMKKAEYERTMGTLVHKDGVVKSSFLIGRILRDKLSVLPSRLAPKVTIESDQLTNYIILEKEVEDVIGQIINELTKVRNDSQETELSNK